MNKEITVSRTEIAVAFRLALEALRSKGSSSYVCHLLAMVYSAKLITAEQCDAARDVIEQRLGGSATYGAWLEKNHPKLWHRMRLTPWLFAKVLFEGRVLWLESLVEEFSK